MYATFHSAGVKIGSNDAAPKDTAWISLRVTEYEEGDTKITFFPPGNDRVKFLADLADQIDKELERLSADGIR